MKLKIGLIGLGEVAQLIHLPILSRLTELFEVAAAHDPSPTVAAGVASRWGISRLHDTPDALIRDADLDAVMVLSPDQFHGRHGRAVLQANKHLFIEKPVCLTAGDLGELDAVASASDRVAMVGYMRRYAPAFLEAKARMPVHGDITYVRVRDVICEGPWFARQVDRAILPQGDVPEDLIAEGRALRQQMIEEVIGPNADADLSTAYSVLTGLSSHSLSAMRDLLGGSPKRVSAVAIRQGGMQITALFDYGHFTALYECMIGDVVRFEAGFEINTQDRRLAFQYPTPYIRNQPMVLEVQQSTETGNQESRLGPFYQDPFDAELRAFHGACTKDEANRTPPSDSRADLELMANIIAAAG